MGENISVTDALALLGNRNNGGAFGDEGVLLLFIILLFGGWGGRGWGGNQGGGYGAGGVGGNELYPWLNNAEQINNGFRDQMLNSGITGIQQSVTNGFAGVQQSLCSGFAGVNQGMSNGFSQTQLAMLQGFNGLQAQQAQCCCDNQLAMANQTAALLAEHCADRQAMNDGIQRVLDQMCQDKIDEKNDIISQLRSELMYSRGQASQDIQTAAIQAGQRTLANEIEQYVAPKPYPAYVVQNPNCCQPNYGCGCGM